MRILLVEDQVELADQIATHIKNSGFVLDCVSTLEDASEALRCSPYALILLDRRLPDGDGLDLVPEIRRQIPGVRILMLTALDDVENKIKGLDTGADDYLTKPCNLSEMMARIRASLRRPAGEMMPPVLVGALSFDLLTKVVTIGGEPVSFHRRELALLESLVRRAGRTVSRDTLLADIYGHEDPVQCHTLTMLVTRVRRKLIELGAHVEIHSTRGVGFLIRGSKT